MKKKDDILSYESAQAELQEILHALQAETIPIDDLSNKIARANTLITFCRERLRMTEEEIAKLKENGA